MEVSRTPPSDGIVMAQAVTPMTPVGEVYRDITRGGVAGLIVGIVLAGVGGRLVMRLAALLQPGAAGMTTENGNVIGRITLEGSLLLIIFIGLFFGAVSGSLWVVIRPWLPARSMARAVVSIPIAVAFGTSGLVDAGNLDFVVLRRDALVIGSLVALVGLFGPALVLTDRWLDGRLPHPGPNDTPILATYAGVTILGTLLTLFLVVPLYVFSDLRVSGLALVVVGLATLGSWWSRVQRRPAPAALTLVGRSGLVVATIAGLWVAVSEVAGALRPG